MIVNLTIFERALVLNIFPAQSGNILALRAMRKFREDCSPTPEEIEEYCVTVTTEGRMTWDSARAKDKEIEIPDIVRERLVTIMRELSDADKLSEQGHLDLWDKIVEGEK